MFYCISRTSDGNSHPSIAEIVATAGYEMRKAVGKKISSLMDELSKNLLMEQLKMVYQN